MDKGQRNKKHLVHIYCKKISATEKSHSRGRLSNPGPLDQYVTIEPSSRKLCNLYILRISPKYKLQWEVRRKKEREKKE
jgi:hypothetical protein